MAFALADQIRNADNPNHSGRWQSNPAAGGTVEAIVAEVLCQLVDSDDTGRALATP